MLEYDLGYFSDQRKNGDAATSFQRSQASYRIAAVSTALSNGARAYAGNFEAASGNVGDSVGNFFFAHPVMTGIAYKSTGTRLSDFGSAAAIRLVLSMESQVRISAGGRELFNGVLNAGDQTVEFQGYQDAFVDVFIRDALGSRKTQRVEVIHKPGGPEGPAAVGSRWGEIYLDAGRIVNTANSGAGFRLSDIDQMGVNYVNSVLKYSVVFGFQTLGERRRYAISLAPEDRSWQINFMRGNKLESGYNFSGSLMQWEKFKILLNQTTYRTPLTTVYIAGLPQLFLDDRNCLTAGTNICHQATSFDSVGFTLKHEDWPWQLAYIETHTMTARFSAVIATGTYHFSTHGIPLALTSFLSRDLERKNNSIFISLSIPLDTNAFISSGLVDTGEKTRAVTASYRANNDENAGRDLRNIHLTGATAWSPAGTYSAAAAHVKSRLGDARMIGNLTATGRGDQSVAGTLSFPHGYNVDPLADRRPDGCPAP